MPDEINKAPAETEQKQEPQKAPKPEKKPKPAKAPKPEKKPKPAKSPKPEKKPKPAKAPKPEKKPKPAKASKQEKKRFHLSLKSQLLIGFSLPILLVAAIGIYAYNKAAEGMTGNYQETTLEALRMTADYIDYGFSTVSSSALELYNDGNVKDYSRNLYRSDPIQGNTVRKNISNNLMTKKLANDFIEEIHIIPMAGVSCMTSASLENAKEVDGFYKELLEEKQEVIKSKNRWAFGHAIVDETFHLDGEKQLMSLYLPLESGMACIVVDISRDNIVSIMQETGFGEGCVMGFVTPDGHEVLTQLTEEGGQDLSESEFGGDFSFAVQDFYIQAQESEEPSVGMEVTFQGDAYWFMSAKCESNGSVICALVPKSIMMTEANELKSAVLWFVLAACVIVGILGVFIFMGISRNMGSIIRRLSRVANGDLTVDMTIKNKAEFGTLAGHIMGVVSNTKDLVAKAVTISGDVSTSVSGVSAAAGVLSEGSQNIHSAMVEIDQGVNRQVQDAEQCLNKMDELSGIILTTEERVQEMGRLADGTKDMIDAGSDSMKELIEQAEETVRMTDHVDVKIGELSEKSREIAAFVDTINEISEQTTLLSLNASIEAARAGEAGKGFAVVAEEIKKLADNSMQAAEEIRKVVNIINDMTVETRESSAAAKEVVKKQGAIVEQTRDNLLAMNRSMGQLLENVQSIKQHMREMSDGRADTLEAIESISSVVEETAASASIVKETVEEQTHQAESLRAITEELQSKTDSLMAAISTFRV